MNKIQIFSNSFFILLFLICTGIRGIAQPKDRLDSLIEKVKTSADDTIKLQDLSDIVDNAPDGVWQKYNEQMADLSKKLMANDNPAIKLAAKKFIAVYNNNLAFEFGEKGDYKRALGYFGESEKVQKEVGDKKE